MRKGIFVWFFHRREPSPPLIKRLIPVFHSFSNCVRKLDWISSLLIQVSFTCTVVKNVRDKFKILKLKLTSRCHCRWPTTQLMYMAHRCQCHRWGHWRGSDVIQRSQQHRKGIFHMFPESSEWFMEGQAFSRWYYFAPSPLPLPSPVRKLDRRHTGRLRKRDNSMTRERGEGMGQIIEPQERLVLYKSFKTLCIFPSMVCY